MPSTSREGNGWQGLVHLHKRRHGIQALPTVLHVNSRAPSFHVTRRRQRTRPGCPGDLRFLVLTPGPHGRVLPMACHTVTTKG